jgi:hypothetical protein
MITRGFAIGFISIAKPLLVKTQAKSIVFWDDLKGGSSSFGRENFTIDL